jgi:hypothetical protein
MHNDRCLLALRAPLAQFKAQCSDCLSPQQLPEMTGEHRLVAHGGGLLKLCIEDHVVVRHFRG